MDILDFYEKKLRSSLEIANAHAGRVSRNTENFNVGLQQEPISVYDTADQCIELHVFLGKMEDDIKTIKTELISSAHMIEAIEAMKIIKREAE